MPSVPPPNPDLMDLAGLLGEDNVRILVRTFLREYPLLLAEMKSGDRKTRHRIVHSFKSNSRVIGAREFSARMAALEARLIDASQPDLNGHELADIARDLETVSVPLRAFVGEA